MSNFSTKQVIVVEANPDGAQPAPLVNNSVPSLLVHGGISVAVIIAIAYFSQVQLNAIAKLFRTISKKR
jgi:hypothetical protein